MSFIRKLNCGNHLAGLLQEPPAKKCSGIKDSMAKVMSVLYPYSTWCAVRHMLTQQTATRGCANCCFQPQSTSLPMLIRASAKFHLRLGSPQVATELLQELHRYLNLVCHRIWHLFWNFFGLKCHPTTLECEVMQLPMSVCFRSIFGTEWLLILKFCMRIDHDHRSQVIVGQGLASG